MGIGFPPHIPKWCRDYCIPDQQCGPTPEMGLEDPLGEGAFGFIWTKKITFMTTLLSRLVYDGIVSTSSYPLSAAMNARPMPMFPDVGSISVVCFRSDLRLVLDPYAGVTVYASFPQKKRVHVFLLCENIHQKHDISFVHRHKYSSEKRIKAFKFWYFIIFQNVINMHIL